MPVGGDLLFGHPLLMVGGGGLLMTKLTCAAAVAGVGELSVTVTVTVDEPTLAGMPDSVPEESSVRPAGNVPAVSLHVSGRNPSVAPKLTEFGIPAVRASGEGGGLITGGPGLFTTTANVCEIAWGFAALSLTVAVNVEAPALEGVPDSDPLLSSVKPGGNAPALTDQVSGAVPPLAVSV